MSVYEAYDRTAQHYDATRVPVGSEIVLGCLARHAKPLSEMVLLDAGCGTGAYSAVIVERVGRIEAIDLSPAMLAKARAKLAAAKALGRIRFHRASIAALPFPPASFDGVMINQVAHHLGDRPEDGFARLGTVITEFARVLRPGGILVFNHCSQEQLDDAYWYYSLAPRGHEAFRRRFAPLETLRAMLAEAGFLDQGTFVPVDAVCQGQAYFDGRGPLDPAWRDGDSFWAQIEETELARALAHVRALDAAGMLGAYVAEHDSQRPAIGQITFVCATLG